MVRLFHSTTALPYYSYSPPRNQSPSYNHAMIHAQIPVIVQQTDRRVFKRDVSCEARAECQRREQSCEIPEQESA
ncbi:hypothetical protein CBOM_07925 [Ceraceosorus bombacis]|uniref:Uncharacterized protein n=1 Tax=Ceraceosorus bombacis TaxID=401625 RepID=A0A0P1BS90_9BASI|nr:hypothetical protein CBOM_07925 [Ceraceosorus bombacis]